MRIPLGSSIVFTATGGREFDPALPTILLIHGAGMDRTAWAWQARSLGRRGCNALALDLPGHGLSDGPALGSVEAMADWVWDVAEALGFERLALAGHSLGSLVALEAASRRPERCRALALVATSPEMRVHPDLIGAAEAGDHRAIDMILDWSLPPANRIGATGAPGFLARALAERVLEAARPGILAGDLKAANAYRGANAAAGRIKVPAVLILGAEDKMTPPGKAASLGTLLAAESRIMARVGHMMMLEAPAETAGALSCLI